MGSTGIPSCCRRRAGIAWVVSLGAGLLAFRDLTRLLIER